MRNIEKLKHLVISCTSNTRNWIELIVHHACAAIAKMIDVLCQNRNVNMVNGERMYLILRHKVKYAKKMYFLEGLEPQTLINKLFLEQTWINCHFAKRQGGLYTHV